MASFTRSTATIAASDFERAKSWWADKVGLKPTRDSEVGAIYDVGGTRFLVYPSQFAGTNQATAMGLTVADVRATVDELRGNGVEFMEYDFPDFKTEDGVATMEENGRTFQTAWFKDSEGNIIALDNMQD